MVWESFDGSVRELEWGELQDLANQAAHTLASCGVTQGDRVAVVLPPTPEAAAIFFGVWKLGAILLSMSVLYGDDGIAHRLSDSGAKLLVTDPGNAPRFERSWAPEMLVLEPETLAAAPRDFVCADTCGGRPRSALLHLRDDRARERDRPRAPLHPRPRGVPLLPRGTGWRALPRNGRVGMGRRDRAATRPLAAGRSAVRLQARKRLRPRQTARLPEQAVGDECVHHANGDALDDGDRGCGDPVSAGVPARVLGGRAPESRGDPLVSRAVRRNGARLLRPDGVVPTRRRTSRFSRCARARWASRCPAGTCNSSTRTSGP